ncbi:ABC-type multidrug transport system, permease component [Vibrio orientalis CIP 102891 = ATCC 33934]|uniref:ABC-type multidrug transport system permease component n=1 Tax=Vibrio orientalis CIP 102891 = ATCC 33934 TaxID=675816 RepID=C9QHT3_VIBOR|nr:ABC transporter permease [Vibrio orientalis]EEX92252.1 ABC-type multidrug transport system permease component [Vibrio orientalis CIP 102891 = ATCC 33934]EGU53237.1 ABC-type multidrug transport system, permease component [Vibrio orientalis CIP 102891 = ATCC 33934]
MHNNPVSQLDIVRRDKWLLSSLTWIPLLLAVMIWAIFSQGIARELPVGVVDLSSSTLSHKLVRYYDATPAMQVTKAFTSVHQAKQALIKGDIYAYAVIPHQFDQEIYKQLTPQVSVFYNSQMILIGKLLNSAFLQAQGTFNAELSTMKGLAAGNSTLLSAMGNAVPVRTQITPLFNKNSNYAQFLVSAIIPALWQIVIVVTTILILAANLRDRRLAPWLESQPIRSLLSTLAPYYWVFALQGFGFLCWFYLGFKWPMNGSFLTLVIAQSVTIAACMVMGGMFFFLTLDAARAMSFAGAFTAPSFAFMGITFPVTDMSSLAQMWRSLLPISHYIEVQVSQVSYGQAWATSLHHLLPMFGYLLPMLMTFALIKKHLTNEVIR